MSIVLAIVFSLIGLILLLIVWVGFTPLFLTLDTDSNLYQISQRGIFSLAFYPQMKNAFVLRLFGMIVPLRKKSKTIIKHDEMPSSKKRKGLHKSFNAWQFLIKGCLKSLRLKCLIMDVDTGDVVVNAQLVPVACLLSRSPIYMRTNFSGRTYLHAEVKAHVYKIVWTSIQFFLLKK